MESNQNFSNKTTNEREITCNGKHKIEQNMIKLRS